MDRKCEECRWFYSTNTFPGHCSHRKTMWSIARWNRDYKQEVNCGPSGRYWEPREEEE